MCLPNVNCQIWAGQIGRLRARPLHRLAPGHSCDVVVRLSGVRYSTLPLCKFGTKLDLLQYTKVLAIEEAEAMFVEINIKVRMTR